MKREPHIAKLPITTIVARSSCPICTALREFQSNLIKHLAPEDCRHFCNAHAWVAANGTPAEAIATIFLKAITDPEWTPASPVPEQCDVCRKMHKEKERRLDEIAEQFREPRSRSWLHDYGMLCSRHGRELVLKLPENSRKSLQELMTRNTAEIAEILEDFLQEVKKGSHAGGGVLGRAAEFLVAQRGIES